MSRIYYKKLGNGFQAHRGISKFPKGWGSRKDLAKRDLKQQEQLSKALTVNKVQAIVDKTESKTFKTLLSTVLGHRA